MLLEDRIASHKERIAKLEASRIKRKFTTQEELKELRQELEWMEQFLSIKDVVHEWHCDVLYEDREKKDAKYYFDKILAVFEP